MSQPIAGDPKKIETSLVKFFLSSIVSEFLNEMTGDRAFLQST